MSIQVGSQKALEKRGHKWEGFRSTLEMAICVPLGQASLSPESILHHDKTKSILLQVSGVIAILLAMIILY